MSASRAARLAQPRAHDHVLPAAHNNRVRLLPRTVQLCIHCRDNPAGFWVSGDSSRTVRRPWCLSCCQGLDPGCYDIRPFDS